MVVTDLHGDWDAYQRYRDRFLELYALGKVDCLIFTGDLIHPNTNEDSDHSLEIVLNVLELQQQYGDAIVYLCGNHELPHIYGFGLSKGKREYTPPFEATLNESGKRSLVANLFFTLPFFVRTRAGVSIAHAGAVPNFSDFERTRILFEWDHALHLEEAKQQLTEMDIEGMRRAYAKLSQADSYDQLARHYLAVTGMNDPRYDDLLIGLFATSSPVYQRLHAVLFTKCEREYGEQAYSRALEEMLKTLSTDYWPQKGLVAGHMTIPNGHQIVANRHLRLASGCHATPKEAGKYLLFNAERQVEDVVDLDRCLYSVWKFT